jgi:aspartate 1-decarboxylase
VGVSQQELAAYKPTMIYVDEKNRVVRSANAIPVQAA